MRQAPDNPYMRDELMDQMETAQPTKAKASGRLPPSGAVSSPYQPEAPAPGAGASAFGSLAGQAAGLIHGNAGTPPTGPEAGAAPPPASAPAPAAAGTPGATAGRYSGFNTQRAQDPSTSAKDAFYAASTRAGSMPSTKDDAEAWFNQYIKQNLIDQGYQVDWVEGDQAFVRTRENPQGEVIDFLIDAGGENPMLGWQSSADGGGAPAGGGAAGPQVNPLIAGGNPLAAIDAQIAALTKSGINIDDIIAALRAQGQGTPAPSGA